MIVGLDVFREHFQGHEKNYALIGGVASYLAMDRQGLPFRATVDLDIVLCVEVLDPEFVRLFWQFIKDGGYLYQEKGTGTSQFYRFCSPSDTTYPKMLELFSRLPDSLAYEGEGFLTPIPVAEEVSSLSAILLNDAYYEFLRTGIYTLDGISVVEVEQIIPLKARAWLDLVARKEEGDVRVRTSDIKKHKNDVFRLFLVLSPLIRVDLPHIVRDDMEHFLEAIESEQIDIRQLGHRRGTQGAVIESLRKIYQLVQE